NVLYEEVVKMVQGRSVDGIILLYSQQKDPVLRFLIENNVPFTMLGKPTEYQEKIMYVDNDNVKAMYDMTKYLASLGHKQIAYFGGDPLYEVNKNREQGFLQAIQESHIKDYYIHRGNTSSEEAREFIHIILNMQIRPTA